jgi:hypothetical protein
VQSSTDKVLRWFTTLAKNHKVAWFFIGAVDGNRDKAIPWVYVSGLSSVSVVPKLGMHMSFRSVELHRHYFVVSERHLSINAFMSIISRNAWAPEFKSTYDRILPFSTFECGPLRLTNKKTKEAALNRYKTPFPSQALSPPHSYNTTCLTHRLNVPCLEHYCLSHGMILMLNYMELCL